MLYLFLDFLTEDEFSLSLSLKLLLLLPFFAENWISWNCNWSVLRNIFELRQLTFPLRFFLKWIPQAFFFIKKKLRVFPSNEPHYSKVVIIFFPSLRIRDEIWFHSWHFNRIPKWMNEWWEKIAATCFELIRTSTSWLSFSPTHHINFIQHSTSEKSKMRRKLPDGYQK